MAVYLRAQADAGAQALMLFESWAGLLAPPEFKRFALRAAARTMKALRSLDVPLIYYANQGSALMREIAEPRCGCRRRRLAFRLDGIRRMLGPHKAVQGNLDPAALFAPPAELKRQVRTGHRGGGPDGPYFQSRPRNLARHRSGCRRTPGRLRAREPRMNEFAQDFQAFALELQSRICAMLESFEPTARFEAREWQRPQGHRLQGGGSMRIMRGEVFEKVGVNVSHVWGTFAPQLIGQIPGAAESDGRFVACGLSLVAHPFNPYVPTVHMNLRYLSTSREWFGGGTDLTPTFPFEEDTTEFHTALRQACEAYRPGAYAEFKEWCDRYFYLPHRREPRGVGGIFFDELASAERRARISRSCARSAKRSWGSTLHRGAPQGYSVR